MSPDSKYPKHLLRLMKKAQPTPPLPLCQIIGNHYMSTGSYIFAIGRVPVLFLSMGICILQLLLIFSACYQKVLRQRPEDPMINFLIGLSFINLSCKVGIVKRHNVALQGVAFFTRFSLVYFGITVFVCNLQNFRYEKLRGRCPETDYNLGRAMHQLNLIPAAVSYYKRVLYFLSCFY